MPDIKNVPPALPPWVRFVREPDVARELLAALRPVRTPQEAFDLFAPRLAQEEVEVMLVAFLNSQHGVLAVQEVTRGILDSSLVHPREVFRAAILMGAAAIIIAHNHPSGEPTPSSGDRMVTELLAEAGNTLGIKLVDHIVIGGSSGTFTSFSEQGLL
jgi:DNA repair protein RadC